MDQHLDSHLQHHAEKDHHYDDRFDAMLVLGMLVMVCAVVAAFIV
jgi:hypothetical protein